MDKAAHPDAINRPDAQGNTPLHYAVAQRDLESIESLIKQGALITAKNLQGETAADWFQVYINSICKSKPGLQLEELTQEIEENNIQFVADCLKAGVSRTLRFSGGETLLHLAVEAQQKAIIELLLEGVSDEAIKRLLDLTNSRGLTPLALARQRCQPGSRIAQEILSYLQAKQRATVAGVAAAAIQIPPPRLPLTLIAIEQHELKALVDSFTHPRTSVEFEQLNPLRSTLVKLAFNIALQAVEHLSKPHLLSSPFRKQQLLLEELLGRLFGAWDDKTRLNFEQKLHSVLNFLAQMIQQQQVDQVIQFSDEIAHAKGFYDPETNTIFLNPMTKTSATALATTLLHEVTHLVGYSYDFFPPDYLIENQVFSIDLDRAYQLAAAGTAERLTPERSRVFEIRQLLEEGFSDCWRQNLYHWMTLNSAETLAMAILALATVPVGAAQFASGSRQTILEIKPQRLSGEEAVTIPFRPPVPHTGIPRVRTPESLLVPHSSGRVGTSPEKTIQNVVSMWPLEEAVGQPPKHRLSSSPGATSPLPIPKQSAL